MAKITEAMKTVKVDDANNAKAKELMDTASAASGSKDEAVSSRPRVKGDGEMEPQGGDPVINCGKVYGGLSRTIVCAFIVVSGA